MEREMTTRTTNSFFILLTHIYGKEDAPKAYKMLANSQRVLGADQSEEGQFLDKMIKTAREIKEFLKEFELLT